MKIRRGNIVQIDWDNYEESLNKRLDQEIRHFKKMGMSPNHPWIVDLEKRFQEILNHKGETAEVMGTYDYGSYINLKFSDGFEFGCERKFIYI
jgi:hypothetical protein